MPRGDGTGPEGRGAMTGRKAGYCSGNDEPGVENDSPRRGNRAGFVGGQGRRGRGKAKCFDGRGRGRGFRFWNRGVDE